MSEPKENEQEEERRFESDPEEEPRRKSSGAQAKEEEPKKEKSLQEIEQKEDENPTKTENGNSQVIERKFSEVEVPNSNGEEEPQRKSVQPTPIVNPLYYYKGHQKYNWRIDSLVATDLLQKLQVKIAADVHQLQIPKEFNFAITSTTNIKGHVNYTIRVEDKKGSREISRRYTEFIAFRNKLVELWPCIFMAALPNKTLMGTSEDDIINNRKKYIVRFLRSLSIREQIYSSEEVQYFLNETEVINMETHFNSIPTPKFLEILEKYKKEYSDDYIYSQRQEFMYRKQKMPQILEDYELYFGSKRKDLMDWMASIKRMTDSKQNYFRAISKLNQTLLPDYEDTLYRWIYGEALPQAPPSIMERMSIKSVKNEEGAEGEKEKEPDPVDAKFGLYSAESYKSKLQDTGILIHDYNSSSHLMYDVLKYELKEIDTVVGAIEQTKSLGRQMEYLRRTITINKEQIESLNSNKTTLKTFFMEGSIDDKKTKLSNDNHVLEQQLEKLTELYYLVMVLLEKQLEAFHQTRANFYTASMKKAFSDELCLTRSIMDFKVFEEQLFAKDREQRIKLLTHQQQEQKEREEVKQ